MDWEAVRAGAMGPRRVARFLFAQEPGARVWQEIGGWQAVPTVVTLQLQQIYVAQAIAHGQSGAKGKGPDAPKPPLGLVEERKRERTRKKTRQELFDRGAVTWKRKLDDGLAALAAERMKGWGRDWRNDGSALNRRASERMKDWS